MFYYEISWFYQDFKSENLFFKSLLSSHSENTRPVTRGHDLHDHLYNSPDFSLNSVNSEICSVNLR